MEEHKLKNIEKLERMKKVMELVSEKDLNLVVKLYENRISLNRVIEDCNSLIEYESSYTKERLIDELNKFTGFDWQCINETFKCEFGDLDQALFDRYYIYEIPPHIIVMIGKIYESLRK